MQLHETSLKEGNQTPFSCPKCGAPLVVKRNNTTGEAFLGCGLYRETQCKGGYPLKREHITAILKHNNMDHRVPTNETPAPTAIKTPESSLPYDPPPPVSEFGQPKVVHGDTFLSPIPQEITVTIKFDQVQLNSLFALFEKLNG